MISGGVDGDLLAVVKGLTPESVIDVHGVLHAAPTPIKSCSCSTHELHCSKIETITAAATPLPFPVEDSMTKLDTRLDHRVIDLRTPGMGAVVRLVSLVNQKYRETLLANDFVEIHTPKLIGTPSEGGSSVFQLNYFGQKGFLAQSPQLYKQMVLMGDVPRVFEIGPVFRAEKSQTHRHLTEFVGLDAEMMIHASYTEVLNVLEHTLCSVLHALEHDARRDVDLAQTYFGVSSKGRVSLTSPLLKELGVGEDGLTEGDPPTPSVDQYGARVGSFTAQFPVIRLSFDNAVQLLLDNAKIASVVDDFSTQTERELGALVRQRYGVDVYIVDRFPIGARPFYTMPCADDPTRTYSYDMYLRGEEICSGAQRIHDPLLLTKRMGECGVDVSLIQPYVDSFKFGAWPHGGFGLGMERIVQFFLGLPDIRQVSLFPRDPKRITP